MNSFSPFPRTMLKRHLAAGLSLWMTTGALAQCLGWADGLAYPTIDGEIYAAEAFGTGLYLGGIIRSAGEIRDQYLLHWDGTRFSVPGGGVNGPVSALRSADGWLYVGGKFDSAGGVAVQNVAAWRGGDDSEWRTLNGGTPGTVYSIAVVDGIVVGGAFEEIGGIAANNIARFNGSTWAALGAGVDSPVLSIAAYDGLVAGGLFRNAGGAAADRIARWDGGTWTPLGSGANAAVRALHALQTQAGVELIVGGDFTNIGGAAANRIASWNGSGFSALDLGFDHSVRTIQSANLDGNVRIIAGGFFEHSGAAEIEYAAWWNGAVWQQLGSQLDGLVHTIAVAPPTPLQVLYAGTSSFDALQRLVGVNGTWEPFFAGGGGSNGEILTMLAAEEGGSPVVYIGGSFSNVAGVRVRNVARFDAASWASVGEGIDASIAALARRSDGSIVAAGNAADALVSVSQWNGSSWTALGSELRGRVNAVVEFDGELFLAGEFYAFEGVTPTPVQRLVGNAWTDVVGSPAARCLAVLEVDLVPTLYAGANALYSYVHGTFVQASDSLQDPITSLAQFNDGSGLAIYAGGIFRRPGSAVLGHVVRLDGMTWSRVGDGLGMDVALLADVFSLNAFDDGNGPQLYALGSFRDADGAPVMNAARWNGQAWSAIDGIGWAPRASAVLPGDTPGLLVGGSFSVAGETHSSRLAIFGDVPLAADLDFDGDVDLQDLANLLANFSRRGDAEYEDGDLDGDRDVDLQDLGLLLANFGEQCE